MESKKMNFVFFFPDEMRASSVSCYGNSTVKMPNYDRLAEEGVRFENCIVQNPVCSPSRCSLMTGWYVHNMGHRTLWHLLRPHEPSMFRYLKENGYDIAWFGKNDLYSQDYLDEICEDIDDKRNKYSEKPIRKKENIYGGNNPYKFDDPRYHSFLYNAKVCDNDEIPLDDNITRAIDYLEAYEEKDKQFMLFLPISTPHPPYTTFEKYHNMYDSEKLLNELALPDETSGKPSFMELIRKYRRIDKLDKEILAKIYAVYLGMNSYVDFCLGEILDTLEKNGLSENTTVIVSSDHGDWAGQYGLIEKWPNAMDDNIVRVPLLIRTPGNKAGQVVKGQVELFDIMPTVLELAGVSSNHTHFAKSLIPQLNGKEDNLDRIVFAEGGYDMHEPNCFEWFPRWGKEALCMTSPNHPYHPKALQQQEQPQSVCRSTMARTLNHKLVKRTSGENELYDLNGDPNELINVYSNPEFNEIRSELESHMLDWYIRTSDIVPQNDDFRGY